MSQKWLRQALRPREKGPWANPLILLGYLNATWEVKVSNNQTWINLHLLPIYRGSHTHSHLSLTTPQWGGYYLLCKRREQSLTDVRGFSQVHLATCGKVGWSSVSPDSVSTLLSENRVFATGSIFVGTQTSSRASPPSPFGNHIYSPYLWACFVNKFICIIFLDSTYKWYVFNQCLSIAQLQFFVFFLIFLIK